MAFLSTNAIAIVKGGGTTQTLFAPTISLAEGTVTIESDENGSFVEGYYVYANGDLITTTQTKETSLVGMADDGDIITVKAYGTGFNDSADSNAVEFVNIPLGVNFATDAWNVVQNTSKYGKTAAIYGNQVGRTRTITLTSGISITLRLANATDNLYNLSDGSRKTGLCVEFVTCYPITYAMHSSDTNAVGWANCQMRTLRMSDIYNLLPADLKSVIATVNIVTSTGNKSNNIATTQDKLFLPAEREVFSSRSWSASAEWNALSRWQYYANNDYASARYKTVSGSNSAWYLRSPVGSSAYSYNFVSNNGSTDMSMASNRKGAAPAFCI